MPIDRASVRLAAALVAVALTPAFSENPSPPPAVGACGCEGAITMETDIRFDRTFTGKYRPGEPYDYVTVDPAGTGETFADAGISIRVRLKCENLGDDWLVGYPPQAFQLYSPGLCMCSPVQADAAPDEEGWFEFSGTLHAGGCTQGIELYAEGTYAGELPINFNSTDSFFASPCYTDASDISAFAEIFGDPGAWDICFDYNESGPPIDASDLAHLAAHIGAACE